MLSMAIVIPFNLLWNILDPWFPKDPKYENILHDENAYRWYHHVIAYVMAQPYFVAARIARKIPEQYC